MTATLASTLFLIADAPAVRVGSLAPVVLLARP
jgi:hypothetical protein